MGPTVSCSDSVLQGWESRGLKFFGGFLAAGLTLTPAPLPGGRGVVLSPFGRGLSLP